MSKNITFTPNLKHAKQALKNVEKKRAYKFAEVVKRAYEHNPDPEVLEELEKWMEEFPEIWKMVFEIGHVIETNLITNMFPGEAAHLALERNVEEIRSSLGYEEATAMEMLLIDNIAVSWLRCQWIELRLLFFMGQDEANTSYVSFWERRLNYAQSRYLRACETLEKIRRLAQKNPLLQVNIAAENGQQVNVAGDVIKK